MAAAKLRFDQVVEIREEDGHVVLDPMKAPVYTLDDLLDQMRPETFHDEVDFSKPVGQEGS